ncbi:L-lactate permease [Nitrobacteraceae bacterium AZCC 1564]
MPLGDGIRAYLYGSATGVWNVDWIVFWGVMLFNTLVVSGAFDKLRRWLIAQATQDVRVQTILFAWAFGALLEGLVGFGYPWWAFVAPILIALDIPDLDAIRVAAIANNAPVSYGALGAPIIALAAVTGYPLLALSGSISKIVAILALLPPWILLYLVSGRKGMLEAWPLAVVGSLAYIAGQLPVGTFLGPYLPDVAGAIVCFVCLLLLLKVWQPRQMRGYGGVPLTNSATAAGHGLSGGDIVQAWLPIAVLIIVVVAWTGPWSKLPGIALFQTQVAAASSITEGATISAAFIVVAPILGFIGVALSGSNTSTNAMFGKFQALVGQILGFPPLLLPTVNSVGAEIGKPVAPQTASVGVSTTRFVRKEGDVIRHNFLWTLFMLGYLILISIACYLSFPGIANL